MYVPECTLNNKYQRVQCHKTAGAFISLFNPFVSLQITNHFESGYCWCAHEETGKPIPGTSVQNSKPNCDNIPSHVLNRPIPTPPPRAVKPIYHPLPAEAGIFFLNTI